MSEIYYVPKNFHAMLGIIVANHIIDPNLTSAALAATILRERIQSLPVADRDDLYEAWRVIITAEDGEEMLSALVAVCEILDKQPVCGLKRMLLSTESREAEKVVSAEASVTPR